MPVDQARLFNMVFDSDGKRLAGVGGNPKNSVGLADAKYGSGRAIDLYVTALEPQQRRRGAARLRACQRCRPNSDSPSKKATARVL